MRLLRRATFLHIINAQSVCSLLSKITTMSFQVAGSGSSSAAAATVKVRLISPPIKPSLCMEQLSTAISKVTHQIVFFPSKKPFNALLTVPNAHFKDQKPHRRHPRSCGNRKCSPKCNGVVEARKHGVKVDVSVFYRSSAILPITNGALLKRKNTAVKLPRVLGLQMKADKWRPFYLNYA